MNYQIDLYGTNWCSYCMSLKKWLELEGLAYTFKDIDLPENEKELDGYKINGIPFLKFTDINTKKIQTVTGFDTNAISKIISQEMI